MIRLSICYVSSMFPGLASVMRLMVCDLDQLFGGEDCIQTLCVRLDSTWTKATGKWLAYIVCLEFYSTHFKYGKQEYLILSWSGFT